MRYRLPVETYFFQMTFMKILTTKFSKKLRQAFDKSISDHLKHFFLADDMELMFSIQ